MRSRQPARRSCARASCGIGNAGGQTSAPITALGGYKKSTPLKPKTFSASTPMSGAPRAPIAPDAHLSNAYTDVLILSGTTCMGGFSHEALVLCGDAIFEGGGRA